MKLISPIQSILLLTCSNESSITELLGTSVKWLASGPNRTTNLPVFWCRPKARRALKRKAHKPKGTKCQPDSTRVVHYGCSSQSARKTAVTSFQSPITVAYKILLVLKHLSFSGEKSSVLVVRLFKICEFFIKAIILPEICSKLHAQYESLMVLNKTFDVY
jgi:hypothetical protein